MVNLLGKEEPNFIDAYFNDITCLQVSIASMMVSLRLIGDGGLHNEIQSMIDDSI